jgi:glycosyltransferase involved in cell wall biosynthesis
MRVAFYAPMKPPDHPAPSGDRRMARSFIDLFARLGHEVELASRLRSYDRLGVPARQERLRALGLRLAARLAQRYQQRPAEQRPRLWFTYHLYHKAPDWLGPEISRALAIPYAVAEASMAARQARGPWAIGHDASRAAIAQADLVMAMTTKDETGLRPLVPRPERLSHFPPFLDTAPFVAASADRGAARARLAATLGLDAERPWLLAVAMMRDDVKLRSYGLLAAALRGQLALDWQLVIVGAGAAEQAVRRLFAGALSERIRFAGLLTPEALVEVHAAADLYVWPACGEAYGMALLEAQAAATPVVAGAEGGVPDIVAAGITGVLVEKREPQAFAAAVATLLTDPGRRLAMASAAQRHAVERHGLPAAQGRLRAMLAGLEKGATEAVPGMSACASA